MTAAGRSYGGRTAGERDAERKGRLLAAARTMIGTEGYPATTVEKVCSAAQVSTRHFYQLYATKEDLFIDVYDALTAKSVRNVLASLEDSAGLPMSERAPRAFLAYLGPMFADLIDARIAFVEVIGASPRIEEVRLRYRESLVSLIEAQGAAAVAAGEVTDRDFRVAALALIGAANAIVHDWMVRQDRPSVEYIEKQLSSLAITLLAA